MIFKRRDKPPFRERLREALYPRKGFWRGMDYIRKRLHRLPDSPHRIALGFACGAFASFTPFFTMHILLAAGLAWVMRGNILTKAQRHEESLLAYQQALDLNPANPGALSGKGHVLKTIGRQTTPRSTRRKSI